MILIKALFLLTFCVLFAQCGVPMNPALIRPADKGLLVNKLQDALQDIIRDIDETAIEFLEAEHKGETGIDISQAPAEDKIGLVEIVQVDDAEYDAKEEENVEIVENIEIAGNENEQVEVVENIAIAENENGQFEVVENIEVKDSVSIENDLDLDDISSEAIRYNSRGESIENPSALEVKKAACKEDKTLEIKSQEEKVHHHNDDNSSIDEHGQRLWDEHGNSLERSDEESSEEDEEEPQVVIKPKKDLIRERLNKKVGEMRDNQLGMRPMESDESAFKDDDDIPVITIPMGQILKTYNKLMQGGNGIYSDSTEEYSDETPDPLENPHLQNILRKIENERMRAKLEQLDPKARRKNPVMRVMDGTSEEDSEDDL